MLGLTVTVAVIGDSLGFSLGFSLAMCCRIWLEHLTQFILIAGLIHTYIMCFSTCYRGW